MLVEYLLKVFGSTQTEQKSESDLIHARNMRMIRPAAFLVIAVSIYWIVIDCFSPNYVLNLPSKICVFMQLISSIIVFTATFAKEKIGKKVTRISFLIYYVIIIVGVFVLNISRNMRLIDGGIISSESGVSVSSFYLFIIALMPLPDKLDSIIVILVMDVGLVLPELLFRTSTYSFFANIVIMFGFDFCYLFFITILKSNATHELKIEVLNDELTDKSFCDGLTGCLNRRSYEQYMDFVSGRDDIEHVGVIIFDIDFFKKYNDYYGHSKGDEVLIRISNVVTEALSKVNNCFLFRYGGEEFVIVIDNATEDELINTMQLVKSVVLSGNIFREDVSEFNRITVTIGGSIENVPNLTGDYVTNADNQLYLGKKSQRNSIFYNDERILTDNTTELVAFTESGIVNNYAINSILTNICGEISDIFSIDCQSESVTVYRYNGVGIGIDRLAFDKYKYNEVMSIYINSNVYPDDKDYLRKESKLENIISNIKNNIPVNIYYRVLRDGKISYFKLRCIPEGNIEDFNSIILAFVPERLDLTKLSLGHAIESDEQTGVYTRQAFLHHAGLYINNNDCTNCYIVISDIENFRLVNKIYGASEGDEVIKYLAKRYTQLNGCKMVGRYGADQFVFLLDTDEKNFLSNLERRLNNIKLDAPISYLSVKYGVYNRIKETDSINFVCDQAMLALRENKHNTLKVVSLYNDEIVLKETRNRMYEANFENALENGDFIVYYQPKFNAYSKTLIGAEALIRWKNEDGSFESPANFIPVLEKAGVIKKLDEYVFRKVCSVQKSYILAGKDPVPISINVSRNTIFQPGTAKLYSSICMEYGLDMKYVPIELTETAAADSDQINKLVSELKSYGFHIHLDDFGTGYSSLSSLINLPIDVVKLDKSLIDNIGNNNGDEILRHIIELSHYLNMEVVAEGVENNDQYIFLRKLGCDVIQGFFFSAPLNTQNFENILFEYFNSDKDLSPEDKQDLGAFKVTVDAKLQYLTAISGIYMTMHLIDLKDDSVTEFATTTNVKEHVNKVHNAAAQMAAAMKATVSPESLPQILEFTDVNTIASRMMGTRSISMNFKGVHFGLCEAQFILVSTDSYDRPEKIIFTTRVIQSGLVNQQNEKMCITDELTGVNNFELYQKDLADYQKNIDEKNINLDQLAVFVVDINDLRNINRRLGQVAGDELMRATAESLKNSFTENTKIYRVKDDNFVCLICCSKENELMNMLSQFKSCVNNWIGIYVRKLSVSYGLAIGKEHNDSNIRNLVTIAVKQKNIAKENYKNYLKN